MVQEATDDLFRYAGFDRDRCKGMTEGVQGARNVIITLGIQGSLVATPNKMELIPAVPADAQDSTAAGDAFNGGLAAALAEGVSLDDAVRKASLVASLSVRRMGAQPSLPTRAEVDAES